jgi:hypothetical protein
MGLFLCPKTRRKRQMRKLNSMDLIKGSSLLGKIGKNIDIPEGASNAQVGIAIFSAVMAHAETDFKTWMADIAEISVEEFEKKPFDYPLEVIEEIAEKEDLTRFFERAKNLMGKIKKGS